MFYPGLYFDKTMLFNLSATSDYQFIYPAFYKNYSLLTSYMFNEF